MGLMHRFYRHLAFVSMHTLAFTGILKVECFQAENKNQKRIREMSRKMRLGVFERYCIPMARKKLYIMVNGIH